LLGFLQKKDRDFIPFESYDVPSDLKVGKEDRELYWRDRKLKRSNFSGPRLGALILGIVAIAGTVFGIIANWDKTAHNLGYGSKSDVENRQVAPAPKNGASDNRMPPA
jgi:hypothetical protein